MFANGFLRNRNGATAYDQYNTSIHHSHELSVFLEEILWYDHDVLIVFMLTWSPNVSPPQYSPIYAKLWFFYTIFPLGATAAQIYTSIQEDYFGKPGVNVLWQEP